MSLVLSGHLHGANLRYLADSTVIDMELPSLAYNGRFRLIVVSDGWVSLVDEDVSALDVRPIAVFLNPPVGVGAQCDIASRPQSASVDGPVERVHQPASLRESEIVPSEQHCHPKCRDGVRWVQVDCD